MAEAVAGLLTSAFVKIAKDKLGFAIAEQANLLRNLGGDLEDMKNVLDTISAALEDAERRSHKEKLVQLWLKRLKDVALDISDVLEDNKEINDQETPKNQGVLSCIPTAYKNIGIANRMKSLRNELRKILTDFADFKFFITQGTSTNTVQHPDKRVTTSYFLPEVEGREGEKQEIINLLHSSSNNDKSGTVIVPIYALGGMGKTTLAQLVYNDDQFKRQYDYRIWVYVSQDFSLLKIGNKIMSQLQGEGAHQYRDLQDIMQCLDNLLCNKKVLIVLDDLWERDDTELRNMKSMLNVGKKVDVIVTTREEGIAMKVSTSKPYKLQPLKDDICWEIIKRSSRCNRKEFENIGLEIAKKCGGVPLAAQAVGCMLQSEDISEWKKINDSDIWNETSDSTVLPSLRLSYQRMPPQLRICFSYCAIFSKGHNIVEHDLIHQWRVLGFTETSKGKEYIKHLLGMSFLQVSKTPSTSREQVVQYTMHDLVHDLARLTLVDELIDFTAQERNTLGQKYYCRYLSLKYDQTVKLASILPSKIRALRFSDSGELDIQSGAFSFVNCLRALGFCECSGILFQDSFGQLKQLRCLIAPRMQNEILPECITELSKLQYLNINGSTQISALPESIGKLGCLRYISLSGCSGISELPKSIGDLKSMVHLDMSGCSGLKELPESFGDLKCMVHLNMSGCSLLRELPSSLGNLANLQHLELSGCSSVKAIPDTLCGLRQLHYLNLSSCGYLDRLPEGIGGLIDLQYLNISSCGRIRELPESLMKLQNLLHLDLSDCSYMHHLGGMRVLTTLQHLDMSRLRFIRQHDLSNVLANLTNLKYLSIRNVIAASDASYVPDWIGAMTNLEHLNLSCNSGLTRLPASIGNLTRLHTLDLSYCRTLEFLPETIRALGLKTLVLHGCSNEVVDEASSLVHFSKSLPDFKVRADDVNSCSNLHLLEGINVNELRIHCLENVRSLEEANEVKLLGKQNLEKLKLAWTSHDVRFLEDKDLLGQLVPPRGLKHIFLQCYRSAGFPGWMMDCSRHLTNLVSIKLGVMCTCSDLPPLGQLPNLELLELWRWPCLKKIDKEFCGGKGAFRRLSTFGVSNMDWLEEWNTTYSVEGDVEEFMMFPVLDTLKIFNCRRLRFKPCPPAFSQCEIRYSDQVLSSMESVDQRMTFPSRAIKLDLEIDHDPCPSMRLLQHFPTLRELCINGPELKMTSLPESMQHLTSLESLTLQYCSHISALPEWLGDLSSLKSLSIEACYRIVSLPSSIQHLRKLQKLELHCAMELKEWCESEENKAKLAHINVKLIGAPAE